MVVVIDGADGKEKRAEVFVGESNSAEEREEDERTEKRDGGCADMSVRYETQGSGDSFLYCTSEALSLSLLLSHELPHKLTTTR